ncbi:MAG: tRNA (guanosine(37)-N1)-methyltransferase TrmD [Gammaproteobacteria bacterium]|nr:tRNA (guanosine(37)-N1)-methyltransferase TrmD [Gammaproteobacteria bacterium]MCF6362961.1 tRNA (guanosine(37)-N1)-methyltransferase TrmD [Gammaproteobacteria bacterium]
MRIDVVTLFPEMLDAVTKSGVSGRAVDRGLLDVVRWNPRDYSRDRHRTVDDRPYGGGPGMVMMVEPLRDAIRAAKRQAPQGVPVIHLSPQGRVLDQAGLRELAALPGMVLVASRYEGVDERLIAAEIDQEWSIGDYVLSGGELAAMVLIDGVTRLLPGALGHEDSAEQDSFTDGLLDHPHYTRPEVIDDEPVPPVLLSGDHAAIRRWRCKQALGRTWQRRPELLQGRLLDEEQQRLLQEFIREHEQN